jgi:putative restriction endonuclease
MVLRAVEFWSQEHWIPWSETEGFQDPTVSGKFEDDPVRVARLMAAIGEGQASFRLRLLNAYESQCAVTGEHTTPVLDAAHIHPYSGPVSNHLQNGLLLTKEFHALFDRGCVTVTPEFRVRVSPLVRSKFRNGRRYYPYDGQPLARLPAAREARPSAKALAWHVEHVFRAG